MESELAADGDVHGAVKSNGLIAETKIVRDSQEKLIPTSGPSSAPSRLSFHGNPIASENSRDSSPRDRYHCRHESAQDRNQLEVKSQPTTTYGPAQRTRARARGKRLGSGTPHPVFFKEPTVSTILRL